MPKKLNKLTNLAYLRGKLFLFSGENDHPASAWMSTSTLSQLSVQ